MIQVRDFIGRQWRLVGVITAFLLVLGAIYVLISPFRYTSQADMIIDTKRVSWVQSEMSSENRTIDGQQLPIEDAMTSIWGGNKGTVLSCVPGKLAFLRGEAMKTEYLLRHG